MYIDAKGIQKKLGHRIRDLRRQKGWTQEQLAYESGLGRASMGAIERGEVSIRLSNLLRLSRVLDVTIPELFKEIDDSSKRSQGQIHKGELENKKKRGS